MLMAFEAAARTGSFTAAAEELNLTQGAVSRQVSALESQLDVQLFKRVKKNVKLTESGKLYAREIEAALQTIRSASLNAMTYPLSRTLNLAILPTFGTRWLIPRFPSFLKENPDITVNFSTKLSRFDFRTESLDAAIHFGAKDWPDTDMTFLLNEEVVPVCSSGFLEHNEVNGPGDLRNLPLLHLTSRSNAWENWFRMNGIRVVNIPGMVFEQFSLITQAAIAGLGVALLPKLLIQNELDSEELIAILDSPLKSDSAYYFVSPIEKSNNTPVVAFRNWLIEMTNDSTTP